MDVEFHYYMTYLIAAKSGLPARESRILAYSAQYIDDNDLILEISKGEASAYRNYISQTMNILKPKAKLLRIYPLFHFIPGNPMAETAWRKDGAMHWLNTTPNSENANLMMDAAIASGDLCRIGIAAHGYCDTWAHQNFIGHFDDFNAMGRGIESLAPNIGHADAGHNPDWPALVWKDPRLLDERVDNRARFIEAAQFLLEKLCRFVDARMTDSEIEQRQVSLAVDLDKAIGDRDQANEFVEERVARYLQLAQTAAYGDADLKPYNHDDWFDNAVNEDVRGLRDRSDSKLLRFDPLTDQYTWRDETTYQDTDWYKFQQAVKDHQGGTWEILKDRTFKGLSIDDL